MIQNHDASEPNQKPRTWLPPHMQGRTPHDFLTFGAPSNLKVFHDFSNFLGFLGPQGRFHRDQDVKLSLEP